MSLIKQYLLDLVAPLVITVMWWIFSRGWAAGIQGGQISHQTKERQKVEFVVVLVLLYVGMFGMTIYIHYLK
jgi:hypothetical protein